MKKLIVMAVLAAFFSVGTSKGQTNQSDTKNKTTSNRGQFVDKNKDGICDNQKNRKVNVNGRNYMDKNNDGICDNNQNKVKNNNCCGQGWKHRRGKGCGGRNR